MCASAWVPGTVNVVPHSHYPTKDGKWIAIACTSDKIFARLAELLGEPELAAEGKWGKVKDRVRHRAEVDAWVTRWTEKHTLEELMRTLQRLRGARADRSTRLPKSSKTRNTRRARTSSSSRTRASARSPCRTCARGFPIRRARSIGWARPRRAQR